MLLALDVGNTNIVLGLYEGDELRHTRRISTNTRATEDECRLVLRQLLSDCGVEAGAVQGAILASVVPALTDRMAKAVHGAFGHSPLVVGPGVKTGMPIRYEPARDVGADRIVNAVAAFERKKGGVIVVDFGTATTFDCVSPQGEYLGGVIVPGVEVALNALLDRAAKLPRVELHVPPQAVGKNTPHALQSGVVFGNAALVDGLVERLEAELGHPCAVIATGGLASVLAPHSRRIEEVDPNLTLEGLRLLYVRNQK